MCNCQHCTQQREAEVSRLEPPQPMYKQEATPEGFPILTRGYKYTVYRKNAIALMCARCGELARSTDVVTMERQKVLHWHATAHEMLYVISEAN